MVTLQTIEGKEHAVGSGDCVTYETRSNSLRFSQADGRPLRNPRSDKTILFEHPPATSADLDRLADIIGFMVGKPLTISRLNMGSVEQSPDEVRNSPRKLTDLLERGYSFTWRFV